MQFTIKNTKKDTIYNLMRNLSYHFLTKDEKTGELNFTHPIRGDAFPRFHVFLKINGSAGSPQGGGDLIFNLHLDQRAPIYPIRNSISNGVYKGLPAHQGEYSGEPVEKEAERIKQFFLTK